MCTETVLEHTHMHIYKHAHMHTHYSSSLGSVASCLSRLSSWGPVFWSPVQCLVHWSFIHSFAFTVHTVPGKAQGRDVPRRTRITALLAPTDSLGAQLVDPRSRGLGV